MANGYIKTLDGWRAIAILMILAVHGTTVAFIGWPVTRYGGYGVDIFFGLSGFLITSRLMQNSDLRQFYIRRVFRILPVLLFYLTALVVLSALRVTQASWIEIVSCLTFWRNYLGHAPSTHWYTVHFWSLSVEEHFYLLWPWAVALLPNRKARRVAIVGAVAVAAWRVIGFHAHLIPLKPGDWRTDVRLDALLYGSWMALAWTDVRRYFRPWMLPATAVVLAFAIARSAPLLALWVAAGIPVLLGTTVQFPDMWFSRLLEFSLLRWIGRLSYSLYVWQELFFVSDHVRAAWFQSFPLNLLFVFACASFSYYFVEQPLIRAGSRIARRAPKALPATA